MTSSHQTSFYVAPVIRPHTEYAPPRQLVTLLCHANSSDNGSTDLEVIACAAGLDEELKLHCPRRLTEDLPVTKRGWVLFSAMAVIWGVPYFFIRVAVKELDPPVVVFGRTSLAAAVLLVLAGRIGAIRPALRRWRPVLIFATIEMAIPWILLTTAEEHLASGLTALIIASVPIVGTIAAFLLGDRHALRFVRLVGIVLASAASPCLSGVISPATMRHRGGAWSRC